MADLEAWAIEWHSVNRLDGDQRHLIWHHHLHDPYRFVLFRTRADARAAIEEQFGYIRDRADLRGEPHGWRMPKAVRVRVDRVLG